jgi:Phosphotransferase enzyme family
MLYDHKKVHPDTQIELLQQYLKIAPYLVPEDEEGNKPTLRHPDLSPGNIFMSDGEISGIIDWQHSVVQPIFLQAGIPNHFQFYGDEASESMQVPQLPDNFDSLPAEEQEIQTSLYRKRQLHTFYLGNTKFLNQLHFNAICDDVPQYRSALYRAASTPWEGDSITLKARLMQTVAHWSELTGASSSTPSIASSTSTSTTIPCPISYTADEVEITRASDKQLSEVDRGIQGMCNVIGTDCEGFVSNEEYDRSCELVAQVRVTLLEACESDAERRDAEDHFPFQDHEEID